MVAKSNKDVIKVKIDRIDLVKAFENEKAFYDFMENLIFLIVDSEMEYLCKTS